MKVLERWWWPVFIPVYTFSGFPLFEFLSVSYQTKMFFACIWVFLGLFIKLLASPNTHLSDLSKVPSIIWKEKPIFYISVFSFWVIICSFFSPISSISFTGALSDYSDGALWSLVLSLIFILVYFSCKKDKRVIPILVYSIILTTFAVFCISILEIFFGKGIFFSGADKSTLPLVTFVGRGHLMGFMALATGILVFLWLSGKKISIFFIIIYSFLIGASVHRAPWISLISSLPLAWLKFRKALPILLVSASIIMSVFIGILIHNQINDSKIQLSSETSASTRYILWKSASRGILQRPIFGWGGGVFPNYFYKFLSQKELEDYFWLEFKYKYFSVIDEKGVYPLFVISENGKDKTTTIFTLIKSHNQILDITLMWGIPGCIFYFIVFVYGIKNIIYGNPLSFGILVYFVFLLTWFIPPDMEGIFFVVLAGACLKTSDSSD